MLDLIGLGLVYDSWLNREDEGPIPGLRPKVLELLRPLVDREELGMQSGQGFYHYPEPGYQQAGFLEAGANDDAVYGPLVMALVASAVVVAAHEVADPADIDKAWIVGTSLDTGPFALLEQMGVPQFKAMFARHVAAGRFDPDRARLVMEYLA